MRALERTILNVSLHMLHVANRGGEYRRAVGALETAPLGVSFSLVIKLSLPSEISLWTEPTLIRPWSVIIVNPLPEHVLWQIRITLSFFFFLILKRFLFLLSIEEKKLAIFTIMIAMNHFIPSLLPLRSTWQGFEIFPIRVHLLMSIQLALLHKLNPAHPALVVESVGEPLMAA